MGAPKPVADRKLGDAGAGSQLHFTQGSARSSELHNCLESEDKLAMEIWNRNLLVFGQCLTGWHKESWKNRNKALFSAICTLVTVELQMP